MVTGGVTAAAPRVSFELVNSAPRAEMQQLSRSGATVVLDLHLPTDRPGLFLRCRIDICSQDLSRHRRSGHQTPDPRSSAFAVVRRTLLPAGCGWSGGGTDG